MDSSTGRDGQHTLGAIPHSTAAPLSLSLSGERLAIQRALGVEPKLEPRGA